MEHWIGGRGICHTVSLDPDGKTSAFTFWKHRGPSLPCPFSMSRPRVKHCFGELRKGRAHSPDGEALGSGSGKLAALCPVVRERHPAGIVGHCHEKSLLPRLGEKQQGLLTFWFWILEGDPEGRLPIQRTAARRARVPSTAVSSVRAEEATPGHHFPPVVVESERAFLGFHSIEMAP